MPYRMASKSKDLVAAAVEILETEHPMTLRQLYYRCVSAGELEPTQRGYTRLAYLMTRLREAGQVPRTRIVDHLRSTLKPPSWSGLADYAQSMKDWYRKDLWASMPCHVEVFVEKDAIAGTIQPVTYGYDVALRVCRGYASISFAGEIADLWSRIKKPIHGYYLGDYDPSGFDIERDLIEKLKRYSGRDFEWTRLGVTELDFEDFDLLRLPVKRSDVRARGFIERYGPDGAEVDALPPTELRRRVERAIQGNIVGRRWKQLLKVEQAEQETLDVVTSKLGKLI